MNDLEFLNMLQSLQLKQFPIKKLPLQLYSMSISPDITNAIDTICNECLPKNISIVKIKSIKTKNNKIKFILI